MIRANRANLKAEKTDLQTKWQMSDEEWAEMIHHIFRVPIDNYHVRGHHRSFACRDYMEALSTILHGYGAESLYPELPNYWYVNVGDTYNTTLIMKDGKLYIGCLGDVLDKNWKLYEEVE